MSSQAKVLTLGEIVDFLEKIGGLPTVDIPSLDLKHFDCIVEEGQILALGGIEVLGSCALLRSVAVLPEQRGRGLAREIVDKLEQKARGLEVGKLFLLTTDASAYFERLGFSIHDRENVPEEVSTTSQFSDLCPASSTLMSKSL